MYYTVMYYTTSILQKLFYSAVHKAPLLQGAKPSSH